jgi:hypothetical protein
VYGLGLWPRERGAPCSCVRKFEEAWKGVAVTGACGFDILYTTGEKRFFKGEVRLTREDCEEKWRVVRVMKLESYDAAFFWSGR